MADECIPKTGRKAILAVSIAGGMSVRNAAIAAGISERTAFYWLKKPEMRQRIEKLREQLTDEALGMLTSAQTAATGKLLALVGDANSSVALGACRTILDYRLKLRAQEKLAAELESVKAEWESLKADRPDLFTEKIP
jgi:hypothetical protein